MSNRKLNGLVALFMASLVLTACGQAKSTRPESVVKLEAIEGSKAKKISLVEKSAKRLDIQTTDVKEEAVARKRSMGGTVVEVESGNPSTMLVYVEFVNKNELDQVDVSQPAVIMPLSNPGQKLGAHAQTVESPKDDSDERRAGKAVLYFKIDGDVSALKERQRMLVELVLKGSGKQYKVIPYASILYDVDGSTWVYTNPQTLAYVRDTVKVDFIDGDKAILAEGPATGTKVVTVGVAELFGIEFGIGK